MMTDSVFFNEPVLEKTCFWGFQPGMTQTGLIIQPQKMVRGSKFRIEETEGFYLFCKGTG